MKLESIILMYKAQTFRRGVVVKGETRNQEVVSSNPIVRQWIDIFQKYLLEKNVNCIVILKRLKIKQNETGDGPLKPSTCLQIKNKPPTTLNS